MIRNAPISSPLHPNTCCCNQEDRVVQSSDMLVKRLLSRIESTEQRQQQLMAGIARVMQSPAFMGTQPIHRLSSAEAIAGVLEPASSQHMPCCGSHAVGVCPLFISLQGLACMLLRGCAAGSYLTLATQSTCCFCSCHSRSPYSSTARMQLRALHMRCCNQQA